MELKTLNDMNPEACCYGINKKELKEEAVKWYKYYDKNYNGARRHEAMYLIRRFFNLKDGDVE
jgi:hypothetical protein